MQVSSGSDPQSRQETVIQEANQAFQNQISNQISRITTELKRMEDLLSFGMVDRRVLGEFRQAVDRVRTTGWQVERWLDGDERGLAVLLTEERIRVATKLASELACDATLADMESSKIRVLREVVRKLDRALDHAE